MDPDALHWLTDGDLRVGVVTDAGPRIAALHLGGGPNLLAELEGVTVSAGPEGPTVALRGGHRMWVAPETAEHTYVDDDRPLDVDADRGEITVTRTHDGLRRALRVRIADGAVLLEHRLSNEATTPHRCAPWGITQFPTGGVGILPVGRAPRDPAGLQASGALVVWPYTDMNDPRLAFGPDWVGLAGAPRPEVTGDEADLHHTKVGADGAPRWVAYLREGVLVTKWHDPPSDSAHSLDLGAVAQIYVDHRFAEIESLGPVRDLAAGQETTLTERWEVADVHGATPGDVATMLSDRAGA
jgi:hypothetical protein